MQDEHRYSYDERERIERYLRWRERTGRAGPRRWGRHAAVVIVALGIGGLIGWLAVPRHASHNVASIGRDGSPSAGVTAPPESSPRPAPPLSGSDRPPAPRPVPRARTSRTAVREPARSASASHIATSDVSAEAATPSVPSPAPPPAQVAPPPRPEPPAASSEAAPSSTTPPPAPPSAQLPRRPDITAPGTAAAVGTPACAEVTAPDGVRSRSRRAVDCVSGWLAGEAREARDGVRREVDEFRTGVDRLGRGLQSLGGKLRRSE